MAPNATKFEENGHHFFVVVFTNFKLSLDLEMSSLIIVMFCT